MFARDLEDGFIHDLVLYQSKTTLEAYSVPMMTEQQAMGFSSQIVSVLASTMSYSTTTTIFADKNLSLDIVRYLKDKNCRYTGTARDDKMGKPPFKSIKVVYMGVEPIFSVYRNCSDDKRKEEISCPAVIKSYNANIGGIDKRDMLVHLYHTPMKSKRRDIKALAVDGLSNFLMEVFRNCSSQRQVISHPRRSSADVPKPVQGHCSHTPNDSVQFDVFHAPVYTNWQTSKYCGRKGKHIEVKHGLQVL
ncbi:PiggyBac transposable element-derived protein 1 [Labeo rohita]|uniref:PiggyBac transposable element-derived protein 1 n=1 Tax=Labeo rohita TaxID=84645 RepID=A0ABQ8MSU1_LABRO|nr:PiggyBac transposable element-derived protein 1 [Labeo rohita]